MLVAPGNPAAVFISEPAGGAPSEESGQAPTATVPPASADAAPAMATDGAASIVPGLGSPPAADEPRPAALPGPALELPPVEDMPEGPPCATEQLTAINDELRKFPKYPPPQRARAESAPGS